MVFSVPHGKIHLRGKWRYKTVNYAQIIDKMKLFIHKKARATSLLSLHQDHRNTPLLHGTILLLHILTFP